MDTFWLVMEAILRKIIFGGLFYLGYMAVRKLFGGFCFDVEEDIKKDPVAVAIVIGCFIIAIALV